MLNRGASVAKVRGNATPRPLKLLAGVHRPHTAVSGTSRLRRAHSVYSRAPNFFRVPGPLNLCFNHWGAYNAAEGADTEAGGRCRSKEGLS